MLAFLNKVEIKDLVVLLKEQLDNGKTVSFTPKGKSMKPMLDGENDVIFLKKPTERLHLFDVALYYYKENDVYSVHRVVDFGSDGTYVFLGDNNFKKEHNIKDEDIIGIVTSFYHKGKHISTNSLNYKFYCELWFYSRPFRQLFAKVKSKFTKDN